jgi:hypothetical protein
MLSSLPTVAILASALLGAPAFACQNPALATSRVGQQPARAGDFLSDVGAESVFADYVPTDGDGQASVVGMWHSVLRLESGDVYDEVFQHFHSDGTELIISNGIPPLLGNVCMGVWKRVGARIYRLRHMTWNWGPDVHPFWEVQGTHIGHFELVVTLRLDGSGRHYTGRWTAQNFDVDGNHLKDLDAEGVVNAVRIDVD